MIFFVIHKSFFWLSFLGRHNNPFFVFSFLLFNLVLFLFLNFLFLFIANLLIFLRLNLMLLVLNFMLDFVGRLNLMSWFNFMGRLCLDFSRLFISSGLVCILGLMFHFGNHLMLGWFSMLYGFLLGSFMLNWLMFNFMLHFRLLLMFHFMLDFLLNSRLYFMFSLMLNFVLYRFVFNFSFRFGWFFLLSLFDFFLLFGIFLIVHILSGCLLELLRDISNCSPVFSVFLLLSSHFNEKSSTQYLFIETCSDEIDGINFAFKNDFERSRVILFDFDQMEVRKCLLNIFFNSLEIAFNQIEWDMFNLIT